MRKDDGVAMIVERVKSGFGSIQQAFERAMEFGKAHSCIAQLADPSCVYSQKHAKFTLECAKMDGASGSLSCKTVEGQLLLYLACETHLNAAIGKCGAKNTGDFLLIFDSQKDEEALYKKFCHELKIRANGKKPGEGFEGAFEKEFSKLALSAYSVEQLVCERMALTFAKES